MMMTTVSRRPPGRFGRDNSVFVFYFLKLPFYFFVASALYVPSVRPRKQRARDSVYTFRGIVTITRASHSTREEMKTLGSRHRFSPVFFLSERCFPCSRTGLDVGKSYTGSRDKDGVTYTSYSVVQTVQTSMFQRRVLNNNNNNNGTVVN